MHSCNSKRTRMLPESFFMFADSIVLRLSIFPKTTPHTWSDSLRSYSNASPSCYPFKRRIPQCPFLPPGHLYPQSVGRSFVIKPQSPERPQQQRQDWSSQELYLQQHLCRLYVPLGSDLARCALLSLSAPSHLAHTWSRPGSCQEQGGHVPGALGNHRARAPWGHRPGPGSPAAVAAAYPDCWHGASCCL